MITTQSTTQSTTTKRRNSIHTNLFDPKLYQVPPLPQGYHNSPSPSLLDYTIQEEPRTAQHEQKVKGKLVLYVPENLKAHLPAVNLRITLLCCVWYVTSSISSNLSKAILSDFPHPVALTELQFFISAALCVVFVTLANWLSSETHKAGTMARTLLSFPEGILPNYLNGDFKLCVLRKFLTPCKLALAATFPMGIFQLVGHISSHEATSLIPVSLVHSVKALSPIMTVCYYRFVKGKQYSLMTYFTLIPLISGVIITCWSTHGHRKPNESINEHSFVMGLFFALLSMGIFVSQNIFAKGILTVKKQRGILPSKAEKQMILNEKDYSPLQIDKLTILFYCSCIGFILTLPIFISNEIFHMNSAHNVQKDLGGRAVLLVLIHGITHFFQAMLAFQLIGMLSPVDYSIANIMKRIVIIAVALTWESHLSWRQVFGLSMTIWGLYGYDKWGLSRK
ncbi:LANO_0G17392g1_1 [Lachancea nothofagi CBS 11611]|uniref:LANO_0G17392g1_1 n=1 Tax=Lachancea nothofagi CBS 11611 TaxID=1266666 RepID=A0A1G4KKW0_9SACH|nr:LANO_0G17392g1_1 [Lachancea nothofagi CBS 11611]